MKHDDILQMLTSYREDLKAFGVKTLALFGSVARDEARRDSDLDFLVEFESPLIERSLIGRSRYGMAS